MPNTSDPLSYDRYAYVRNNPLKYTDPTGHRTCSAEEAATGDETCSQNYDENEHSGGFAIDPMKRMYNVGYEWGHINDPMNLDRKDDDRLHAAVDVASAIGNNTIYAPYDGTVYFFDNQGKDFGNGAIMFISGQDRDEFILVFAHLLSYNQFGLSDGSFITKGTAIGIMGSSGNSSGPHLHYEVRQLSVDDAEFSGTFLERTTYTLTYVKVGSDRRLLFKWRPYYPSRASVENTSHYINPFDFAHMFTPNLVNSEPQLFGPFR